MIFLANPAGLCDDEYNTTKQQTTVIRMVRLSLFPVRQRTMIYTVNAPDNCGFLREDPTAREKEVVNVTYAKNE